MTESGSGSGSAFNQVHLCFPIFFRVMGHPSEVEPWPFSHEGFNLASVFESRVSGQLYVIMLIK
jgi:hypothetical protein